MRYSFLLTSISCFLIGVSINSCGSSPNESNKTSNTDTSQSLLTSSALLLAKSVQLPNVKGGFDLMAVDANGQRLFLSAQDNNTLEIVDLKAAKPITSLSGFNEPKWVVYRPETNRLYVSTGGDGKVWVLDATTYKKIKSFSFKEKCNNLRFDTTTQKLYVGVGNSFGSIGVIDVENDKIIKEIPLSDFPKQFEVDGNLLYANIPSKNCIDVVDLKANKVITSWVLEDAKENVPMALDRKHHRLFIACEPGKFIVFSTQTGKSIQSLNIGKEADGIYYDAKRKHIYVSCGEGKIEVIHQKDADRYEPMKPINTVAGAGTSLFNHQLDKYILAVPQSSNQTAEIIVYQPQ